MKVLSLFDGISCGYEALLEAGIPIEKYYASEIDKYAIKVATTNHPDIEEIGDVCNVHYNNGYLSIYENKEGGGSITTNIDSGKIDLVIGGSPCTGFSLAGKQLNFNDPQSKLFFEYLRILKEVKPKYFLLENVKMKKEYQDKITELLWGIEPVLIDSALLTAQRRKRNYWVGELQEDGTYKKVDIPQPEDKGILLKDILLDYVEPKYDVSEKHTIAMKNARSCGELNLPKPDEKCGTLIAGYYKTPQDGPYILKDYYLTDKQVDMIANWKGYEKPLERVKGAEDKMDTLTTHCGKMSNGIKLVSVPCATQLGNGYGYPNAYGSDKAYILRAHQPNGVIESIEPPKIRKLHPIECERLQGLREVKKQYNILLNLKDLEWFIEQAKNYVNAEEKNHKLQNVAENVAKKESKENAKYADENLNSNNQKIKEPVQKNVHISLDRLHIENVTLVNEFGVYASYADDDSCAQLLCLNEDSALGSVDIAMLVEKIVHLGNDESREKDECLITLKNDTMQLRLSEKEIMQRVKDAKLDSTTVKKLFTFITSNHSDLKNQEQTLITLFCYVLIVIIGFTHGKILNENSLTIETSLGYTYGVSDSQRYKQLGNGWTVPVISHIFKHLIKQND